MSTREVCGRCGPTGDGGEMTMRETMAQAMRAKWEAEYGIMARAHWNAGIGLLLVDAAIDTLMNPTQGMVDDGVERLLSMHTLPPRAIISACFQAMIGAAKESG